MRKATLDEVGGFCSREELDPRAEEEGRRVYHWYFRQFLSFRPRGESVLEGTAQ